MTVTARQIDEWLRAKEDEHLEFKEAKNNFHFESLVKYCAALANEGGGSIVLGVTDAHPRKVVGSQAFTNLERTKAGLIDRIARGKLILSHKLHQPAGKPSVQTQKRDQTREQNKARLLEHIVANQKSGSALKDLIAVVPDLARNQVQMLLKQLREEGKAQPVGATKSARWYPRPEATIAGGSQ